MTGIMLSNPFNLLSLDALDEMASNVGVVIGRESFPGTPLSASTEKGDDEVVQNPEMTPVQHIDVEEQDDWGEGAWTEVHRRRGKHPRKSYR